MNERTEMLIGKDNLLKIQNVDVLIVGIGGVGGTALETLVRSGVKNITIIDYDKFDITNVNRQILSNNNVINEYKVNVAIARCLSINPDVKIISKNIFLDKNNINEIGNFDYIIDACDSVQTKIELIKFAITKNIKIISSMGMGNRLDPSKVYITKLSKTENDPLAKKIRTILRKENINLNINVVASKEIPIKSSKITSMMCVPSVAGIYMAHYIISDIIKK